VKAESFFLAGVAIVAAYVIGQSLGVLRENSDVEELGPIGWDEVPFGSGDDMVTVRTASQWVPPKGAAPYLARIQAAEDRYGLPRNLLARLIYQETRFRDDIISGRVKSPVGAAGIGQFMPATAAEYGIDPLNVDQSINASALYLSKLYKRFGNWREALAAYNWGQGNVSRKGLANAPLETRNYFSQILGDLGLA
jgi:soluble lytic murein transglycosylase-like protein